MKNFQAWAAKKIAKKIRVKVIGKPQISQLRRPQTSAGSYIAMRTAYGKQNNWPLDSTNTDIDHYDRLPDTTYFLSFRKRFLRRGRLIAGLRLTKIKDFEDSLSLEMWSNAEEKQKFVGHLLIHQQDVMTLKRAAKNGRVWDLTRLVTAMALQSRRSRRTKRLTYVALLMALGAAFKTSGSESYWIFTCNPEIKRFLDKLGIQYHLIAQGLISKQDSGESYFAWISAQAAYNQLKNGQPAVAEVVQRGYSR